METNNMKEAIQEAKRKLVSEKILKQETLDKKVTPLASHDADNYDWRYLSAATFI
jgi:hypothetical protein